MSFALVLALFAVAAQAAEGPKSAQEAVATFQRLWRESLGKQLESSSHFKLLNYLYAEPGRVGATRQAASVMLEQVSSTLTANEQKSYIVVGTLKDLEVAGDVWEVVNPGGGPGFRAYLDAKDGHLIFLWTTPEG